MPTVIDSLVVMLGLDSKGFKQGQQEAQQSLEKTTATVKATGKQQTQAEKRALAERGETERYFAGQRENARKKKRDADRKDTEETKRSVKSVGDTIKQTLGLFGAAIGIKAAFNAVIDTNVSTRALGINSKNQGIAPGDLKTWQNIVQGAGGNADEAAGTVNSLNQSLFSKNYMGELTQQDRMLRRLGVSYETFGGKLKPIKQIALDTADAIKREHMTRENASQYLAQIFDSGTANLILDEAFGKGGAIAKAEAEQKKIPQVSEADAKTADRASRLGIRAKQTLGAYGGKTILKFERELFGGLDAQQARAQYRQGLTAEERKIFDAAENATSGEDLESAVLSVDDPEKRKQMLRILSQDFHAQGNKKNSVIVDTELRNLLEANPDAIDAAQGADATPGATSSTDNSQRATTSNTTQIDSITINTQATDANGIAGDMTRAIQDKNRMQASQAESGKF